MYKVDFCVIRDGVEADLTIQANVSPHVPGRYFGPPEKCYPDEGGEVEIETILCQGEPWMGELTDYERSMVDDLFFEELENDEPDYEPDYYD